MSRTVLLTGVSSGIGLGLLRACLAQGDQVFGLGRRPPPDAAGLPNLRFTSCDLADASAIPAALDALLLGVHRVDLVILNAGILTPIADMAETSLETLKGAMDVNLWANKVLLDALFASGKEAGQVVAISSGAAVSGARGWNGYALSKAALNMLVRLYAAERPETHFSALAPGLVDTAMQEAMRKRPVDPRFPTVERLKQAQGTADMPGPEAAAPRLLAAMERLRSLKSGDFHDLRSLH
jgi:NAD(P)-dependent dehydrogenase (short-subunit alcohol dehydrogenase family)